MINASELMTLETALRSLEGEVNVRQLRTYQ